MALFNKDATEAKTQQQQTVTQANDNVSDEDFFNQFAEGEGLEDVTSGMSYLGVVQRTSKDLVAEGHEPGTFVNSSTGENFGPKVRVIFLDYKKTIWVEKDKDFRTVGRYPVQGVEVRVEPLPEGKQGYPPMFNIKTGNPVQELPVAALMLADKVEDGVLIFNPTSMSASPFNKEMKKLKRKVNGRTPSIFEYVWELSLVEDKAKNCFKLESMAKCEHVSVDLFKTSIQSEYLTTRKANALLLAAPVGELEA